MKKFLMGGLALAALAVASVASAQSPLNPVFEKVVGGVGTPAFFANDNNTRSGALNIASTNASGESVVIVSRTGAPAVHVVDYSNGENPRTLDITGVSGGVFTLNAVVVADDGAVYVTNTINTTGTSGAGLKVYAWPSDAGAVAPTQIANDALSITSRAGDTINVVTSGLNRTVYVAGANAAARVVAVSSANGGSSWTTAEVGPTRAALGVAGDVPGGSIFLKSGTANPIEYDQAGLQLNDITTSGFLNGTTAALDYGVIGGQQYLVVGSYAAGTSFVHQVLNITNRGAVTLDYTTASGAVPGVIPGNANTNGTGSVSIASVDGGVTVFGLVSNNVYAVYGGASSVSDWDLMF